jgi:uncharacterized protein (DUF697 family)
MALDKMTKIHGIIHAVSATAAGIGAGLAQFPCSDSIPLSAIQTGMISAIAMVHNRKINEATATSILGTLGASMFGRAISQCLVGWIPAWGNGINAMTAMSLTETVGWGAHAYFENLGEEAT